MVNEKVNKTVFYLQTVTLSNNNTSNQPNFIRQIKHLKT
ncbi:MAG: hypothetical protein ACI9LM_004072 [Alteromonadaceae bacterium]|jgi:hypothetical protein